VPIHNTTQGNKSISTEVREIALKEEQLPNDYVTLQLDGIEVTWGDEDLFQWFADCLLSAHASSVAGCMCGARHVWCKSSVVQVMCMQCVAVVQSTCETDGARRVVRE